MAERALLESFLNCHSGNNEVVQLSKKQLLSAEKQIKAEFNKLHQFLKEEEESSLAALREEEEQKGRTVSREMRKIQEQISSLSDSISAVKEELQKHSVPLLSSYKPTQTRARVQCSWSDPQLVSGALMDVAKHLDNLSFSVWEKMKDKVHFSPVILDPNIAPPWLYVCDDLTSEMYLYLVCHSSGLWGLQLRDRQLGSGGGRSSCLVCRFGQEGRVGHVTPKYRIWCLTQLSGEYTEVVSKTVTVKKSLQRIRVQLDYDRREVSFFDPEDLTHIYTCKDTLTEKPFLYFNIGEAADIKICQADISLRCSGRAVRPE